MTNEVLDINEAVRAYIAQIEGLRAEIGKLDATIATLRQSLATLKGLKTLGEGKTVLVPVGSIAQVEMKVEKMDKVVVSVGQNISAELDYEEALKYIEDEIKKLLAFRLVLEQAIAELYAKIEDLIAETQQTSEENVEEEENEEKSE
ncbi:prefoldin, alpha subunit [Methanocaldococcus vulcanius M7]|uniref:Prefoldin subunit alpha n=1 Tax=Methanocaldococcus vulcanius (strain ATCC 700851 / DSM 12094 / M7) TaxID=579137 RepID=C9RFP4_METVM|nr:prefoldin subunit alpha [Methanocaldococcus vulcanius]ACX72396.1 prefoldin, alpha subunit [Methanocaldococcus vulcanius M7]